jgi:hypothetical protein
VFCQILSGILRSLCYSNGKNLFFGSLLLYNFRIFEHRYGPKRFAVSTFDVHVLLKSIIKCKFFLVARLEIAAGNCGNKLPPKMSQLILTEHARRLYMLACSEY